MLVVGILDDGDGAAVSFSIWLLVSPFTAIAEDCNRLVLGKDDAKSRACRAWALAVVVVVGVCVSGVNDRIISGSKKASVAEARSTAARRNVRTLREAIM